MKALRALTAVAVSFGVANAVHASPQISKITGVGSPEFAEIDEFVVLYMDTYGIKAGVVGIIKDGVIVYQRGFDTPENTTLRVASVEKPFTAAAIQILASPSWNLLQLTDFVFDLGQPQGGILDIPVWNGTLGSIFLKDITVQNLLDHEGGWDSSVAEDPIVPGGRDRGGDGSHLASDA